MTGALIILAVTLLTGLLLFITHRKDADTADSTTEANGESPAEAEECCGRHAVCDKVMTITEPIYFDDEELDRFAGREPDAYTPEETEEFRKVLYTLLPSDVYPWGASLTVRDIALPTELRDEWIMLCDN